MYVRRHARNFEVWEFKNGKRRTHVWRAQGRTIPPSILNEIPAAQRPLLQEKVDRILHGSYPEPPPTHNKNAEVERFLEATTQMCSRVRWGQLSPDLLARVLVASVRLQQAMDLSDLPMPKRGRRSGSAAHKMAG